MVEVSAIPPIGRADVGRLVMLFGATLVLNAGMALASARVAGIPLSHLGAYFDGHLYIEIAKSFPLPFAPEARAYLGQAPGYAALTALLRGLVPSAFANWGTLALVATWLPAALSPCAFYLLCREVGVRPFWPSVWFALGNPRWLSLGSNPHAEPLAMLLLLLCLVAWFRQRLGWSVALLSAAGLCRFPALLLLAPMAADLLLLRRPLRIRALLWLGVPPAVFALYHVYLALRVPGFEGVWAEHAAFWAAELAWPFKSAIAAISPRWWKSDLLYATTYLSLLFYLASIVVGLRPSQRRHWILPLWVAVLVGLHVSLKGLPGVWALTRLVVLAWPAALLVFWIALRNRIPPALAASLCAALAAFGLGSGVAQTAAAIEWQRGHQPFLSDAIRRLDSDRPRWLNVSPPRAAAEGPATVPR